MPERGGIERGLRRIDFVRGLAGILLLGGIGVASLSVGGLVGWLLGAGFFGLAVGLLVLLVRGRW